uniref:FA complementation group E n=1 Tax=Anas platyrhynchos TaxID=8839 RepID=A0A8B9ZJ96_ANAPL
RVAFTQGLPGVPAMELPWLKLLARPCRLLLHALASGPSGPLAALRVLQRVQAQEGPFPWQGFTAALCMEEPTLEGPEEALAVKPRLLLLPVVCQRNLFSLLQAVAAVVPADCVLQLLRAARGDPNLDPWVQALGALLQRGLQGEELSPPPPALTAACRQQLKCLCQKIAQSKSEGQRKLKWCPSEQLGAAGDAADSVLPGGKRKKVSEESLELDEGRGGKRVLLEEVVFDLLGSQDGEDEAGVEEMPEETAGDRSCWLKWGGGREEGSPRAVFWVWFGALPRGCVSLQRSELSIPPELRVLSHCSASQLEGLCSFLQLSTCPEQLLVRFCGWLAAVLAEQLFLKRVLSLTQPPSRHLMAALTSFCSKYSQPFCQVLVAPVLQEPGGRCTKLLCELVEECLEPDYVRLVLSNGQQSSLLPFLSQEALPPELFDLLVLTLCRQAPAFATSLSYAKLVTAVLTMYQSHVTPAHRSRLAAALEGSNAALKKSLQAVLGAR